MDPSDAFARFPHAELAGTTGNARLRLCTVAYEFPKDTSYDADWHLAALELTVGPFRAALRQPMYRGEELQRLWNDLGDLVDNRIQMAEYDPIEPYLWFQVSRQDGTVLLVEGPVNEETTTMNVLAFEFATDTVAIECFRNGLQRILERFPVRGTEVAE